MKYSGNDLKRPSNVNNMDVDTYVSIDAVSFVYANISIELWHITFASTANHVIMKNKERIHAVSHHENRHVIKMAM